MDDVTRHFTDLFEDFEHWSKAVNQNLQCLYNSKPEPKPHQAANLEDRNLFLGFSSITPKIMSMKSSSHQDHYLC